jgi:quinoprotein dehydrogenase-associated probable ABC transporter substrate-binding protein
MTGIYPILYRKSWANLMVQRAELRLVLESRLRTSLENKLQACLISGLLAVAALCESNTALAQVSQGGAALELIDPNVFRACADPRNMPFSAKDGAGFENKVAELFAKQLGKSVAYMWYPGATGFVRNTLGAYKCDVIMGIPQGDDLVQVTNPYYRTTYALVFKPEIGLDGVSTLADPRLKDKRVGIVAGTPPATNMTVNGLMTKAKPYPLGIDTRVDSSAAAMMQDLANGGIDVAVLWGPMAGYYAKQSSTPLTVVPLTKEKSGPALAYRISMGVRFTDQDWKRELNRLIRDDQPEINRLLLSYGVPLLDDQDQVITQDVPAK